MSKVIFLSIALVTLAFSGQALITEAPADESQPSHALLAQREYIGAARCKTCHNKAEKGEQFTIWEKSPHAKAYEVLAGDKAKAVAKEKGIDNPQTAGECLQCHVTAHGVDAQYLGPKFAITDGVSCESCHGPGGDYYKKATMEGIASGAIDAASVGLVKPNEQTCKGCHNEKSPTYKAFNFAEAKKKIAHPMPK